MTDLMQIQDFVQAYVQAVASIIEAEVTVVDSELIRVGGTGIYAEGIGEKISHFSFFEKVMNTKKPGVIEDVHQEFTCANCERREKCKELANIAYPIILENKSVGVVGIIAMNEEERERLFKDLHKLEEYVKYMSVLLENKIVTYKMSLSLENKINEVIKDSEGFAKHGFIGKNQKIRSILNLVEKVAKTNSTVLLTGESGTGKEIIAKMIHRESDRRKELMISINCAAIPEHLVESELFGYQEGAFTGSKKGGHVGKFELANHSTLFLDEVGEMPYNVQTKLLRVLQEGQVERIGGKSSIPIDVRVICATNRNLEKMVEEGKFRKDLYYRLNVIPIEIPPLRERREDIPLLAEYYIDYYNNKLKKSVKKVDAKAMNVFKSYDWPGNVRELKNVIEYLENIVDDNEIKTSDLPNKMLLKADSSCEERSLKEIMDNYEKMVLENLVKKAVTAEDKAKLAKQLGISRATLYRKLADYGI